MGVVDKFWSFLGVEDEEVGEEEQTISKSVLKETYSKDTSNSSNNVVRIHGGNTIKVTISEPASFDEVQALADHLKNRRQLILNFEKTPPEVAQRLADFLSGTIYALDGQFQQLGTNIYVFAPNNMEFTRDTQALMRKHNYYPQREF